VRRQADADIGVRLAAPSAPPAEMAAVYSFPSYFGVPFPASAHRSQDRGLEFKASRSPFDAYEEKGVEGVGGG